MLGLMSTLLGRDSPYLSAVGTKEKSQRVLRVDGRRHLSQNQYPGQRARDNPSLKWEHFNTLPPSSTILAI